MTRISRVVPAILTDSPEDLQNMVHQAEVFTDYVQFDIMDGQFVPSRSITWQHLANLPTKLSWEAHLMVKHPEDYLENFQKAGAQKVVFHYEATTSPQEPILLARNLGLSIGLAINPETSISVLTPLASNVDSVLFLSVNPGFYGSKFMPEVLDKIVQFRSLQSGMEIGIDGGISEKNIVQVAQSGVDVIYVGSAIFRQPQPAESFRRLTALAQGFAPL